ncbi:MAG: His/Gly/Thr/Pro-type tRNA ligase C-terminal domain-containing protein, partial [Anaerolineae bacterium]
VDDREESSPGWTFNDWEMKGVPLRIEIGPKDVENAQVVLARRDIPGREGKQTCPMEALESRVDEALKTIQSDLFARALRFREENMFYPRTYAELAEAVENGFALAPWCGSEECEAKVKEDTKATTRCIPFEQPEEVGPCVVCGRPAEKQVLFARAY